MGSQGQIIRPMGCTDQVFIVHLSAMWICLSNVGYIVPYTSNHMESGRALWMLCDGYIIA
jgi:hypothetical protein